jgi:UDP-glucose 4-epimerase
MDIAVVGASGFVGRNVVSELVAADHRVRALDVESFDASHEAVSSETVDVTDAEAVAGAVDGADAVAHLAAHPLSASVDHPRENAMVNVVGSLNVLDAARETGVEKVFFASASSLVGEVETVPVPEDHPVAPTSPYGVAKHAVEEYLDVYQELYGLDFLAFRFFNVYGPHQHPDTGGLVPVVLSRLTRGEGVFVTGDGSQTRDFVYVGDVAEYVRRGLESDVRNAVVNMGRGTPTSVRDAIDLMADVVGVDPDVEERPERPDEIDDFYADTTRCERLFGDAPDTDLRTGLHRTYDWLTDDLDLDPGADEHGTDV